MAEMVGSPPLLIVSVSDCGEHTNSIAGSEHHSRLALQMHDGIFVRISGGCFPSAPVYRAGGLLLMPSEEYSRPSSQGALLRGTVGSPCQS